MITDILKKAEMTWREIARLATPLDSNKPVHLGTPKQGDFEAYTDDKSIFVNVDEKKFKKNFEDIIVPAYEDSMHILYGLPKKVSSSEVLPNLVFDNFLFVYFHEQLHPWLCPNSPDDRKKINKALYDGVIKAEPSLSKGEAMMKVNNSKNLIWDIVLNVSFLSKTAGYNNEDLEQKITNVFAKEGRVIDGEPVTHYPQGILPIVYAISANNKTTDIPISLVGAMYSTMSFNNPQTRENVMKFFFEDLKYKKIDKSDSLDILKKMYGGFIHGLSDEALAKAKVDRDEFKKKITEVENLKSSDYEENQKYFISSLTRLFDSPACRYDSLKGFMKVLSPYISLDQKQGSPDQNSTGGGSGDSSDDPADPSDKSQDEMDGDSISDTLDDLLGEMDKKEANDLLGELSDPNNMNGSRKNAKRISVMAADEYYKKNAQCLEVRNPSEHMLSFDIGNKKRWKHIRTDTLTSAEVSRLNVQKLITFQKVTGLPVLIEAGNGFFKLNQYVIEETPQKSYTFQKSGIEIPDNWVFFQDSSSSMGDSNYVGSGCKFDLLNHVKYGLTKGLYEVCRGMKKDLKFGVVDFSDTTRYGGLDSLVKVFESRNHPIKDVSLTPQCGGTSFNSGVFSRIKKDLAKGRTIYTFVTDGEIQGDTTSLYREIEKFSLEKDNAFVFVEIDSTSSFGQDISSLSKKRDSVLYYKVNNVKSIKDKLGKVLIKYG